jgi:hypothetical protein
VTFAAERAEQAPGQCCFWLKGGGVDAALTSPKGFGIAASVTGDYASVIAPGVNLSKIAFLAGPRYTFRAGTGRAGAADRRLQVFGQGLFGGVYAFDGVFPSSSGTTSNALSFALQAGGGLNLMLTKSVGIRLFEAEFVRTTLPNGGSNVQNDLRLAAGMTWHIGKH